MSQFGSLADIRENRTDDRLDVRFWVVSGRSSDPDLGRSRRRHLQGPPSRYRSRWSSALQSQTTEPELTTPPPLPAGFSSSVDAHFFEHASHRGQRTMPMTLNAEFFGKCLILTIDRFDESQVGAEEIQIR